MENFKSLETQSILEMLARYNEEYSKLLKEGTKEALEERKNSILLLEEELNSRKLTEE